MLENTKENKAKFFALHWGQNVQWDITLPIQGNQIFDLVNLRVREDDVLVLKPISQISDEDAVEVAKIIEPYFQFPKAMTGHKTTVVKTSLMAAVCTGGFRVCIIYGYKDSPVDIISQDGQRTTRLYAHTYYKAIQKLIELGYYVGDGTEVKYGWVRLRGE